MQSIDTHLCTEEDWKKLNQPAAKDMEVIKGF
jgi:hypothetical protein